MGKDLDRRAALDASATRPNPRLGSGRPKIDCSQGTRPRDRPAPSRASAPHPLPIVSRPTPGMAEPPVRSAPRVAGSRQKKETAEAVSIQITPVANPTQPTSLWLPGRVDARRAIRHQAGCPKGQGAIAFPDGGTAIAFQSGGTAGAFRPTRATLVIYRNRVGIEQVKFPAYTPN